MTRVALYLRASPTHDKHKPLTARPSEATTEAPEGETRAARKKRLASEASGGLDSQRRQCLGLCQSRDWIPVAEYVDFEISGARDTRPGLDSLLRDVRSGRINVILVSALDRLARGALQTLTLAREFRERGVDLVSCRESLDTTTPVGRMMLTMLAGIAEMERENILSRINHGIAAARARGVKFGRVKVQVDCDLARALIAQGYSIRGVARRFKVHQRTLTRRLEESDAQRGPVESAHQSRRTNAAH